MCAKRPHERKKDGSGEEKESDWLSTERWLP